MWRRVWEFWAFWALHSFLTAGVTAQVHDRTVPHPALEIASSQGEAMLPEHQLGRFGESFVAENLRASGYEVHDANLNGRGIDLLAVKRNPQGELVEVRPIEVKTRSRGVDFRLDTTRDGRQLSSGWTEKRLAQLSREHPDPALRRLASEVMALKDAHPERIKPQLHGLSIGDNSYQVLRVEPKSGVVEGVESGSSVERFLKRIAEAEVAPATRQAANRHLQQFDQIQARLASPKASASAAAARSANTAGAAAGESTGSSAKAIPEAAEIAAAESGILAKALPAAAKGLAVAAVVTDGVVRGHKAYQVEQQFQKGEISDRDRMLAHVKNGGGMAGGLTGAITLGGQGAAWGSVFGPVGTGVGGLLGGAAGYLGGEKAVEAVVDYGADAIYSGVNATRDAAGRVNGQATRLWNLTKSRLGW